MTADTDQFSDLEIFAKTLDGEAGNQGYEGQQCVAEVIMQRVALHWQGETTIRGVCLHHNQFSCWNSGTNPDRDRIMKSTDEQCLTIAGMFLRGFTSNYTKGADSYIVRGTDCYWADGLEPVYSRGAHDFYITRSV